MGTKEKEFEAVLNRFSKFIKIQIEKFNLYKFGLDPEDISQEVKMKIWKILNNEKKITNYSSYIRKIVNSAVIDKLRKLRREEEFFIAESYNISDLKNNYLSDLHHEHALRVMIAKAVDSLIESRRKVVKLYLLNLSLEEIAGYLNWSKDKTRNLLYRGLNDLKNKLKEMEIEYENQ